MDDSNLQRQFSHAKDKGDLVFVPVVVGMTVNDKTEVKSDLTGTERVLLSFPTGTRKVSSPNGGYSYIFTGDI